MRHPLTWAVIALIAGFVAIFAWPALAQDAPVIARSSIWFDLWTIVQPLVVLFVSIVGPVMVTWISARVLSFLKVADEEKRIEIEAKLRDALHQSALNAVKFAVGKAGGSSVVATGNVITEAIGYVQEKNPEGLQKLGVSETALRDIILSKLPDLIQKR